MIEDRLDGQMIEGWMPSGKIAPCPVTRPFVL